MLISMLSSTVESVTFLFMPVYCTGVQWVAMFLNCILTFCLVLSLGIVVNRSVRFGIALCCFFSPRFSQRCFLAKVFGNWILQCLWKFSANFRVSYLVKHCRLWGVCCRRDQAKQRRSKPIIGESFVGSFWTRRFGRILASYLFNANLTNVCIHVRIDIILNIYIYIYHRSIEHVLVYLQLLFCIHNICRLEFEWKGESGKSHPKFLVFSGHRCQLKGMLNEAAETKAWCHQATVSMMLVFTISARLRPLSSRPWTAPSNSCRKQRQLWRRLRTLNVKEFRSWRSRQVFIVEWDARFSEDFVKRLVTCDENIITSNMRNQMCSRCLL